MSGLCGWINAAGGRELAEAMAAPLARFDGVPVQVVHARRSAAAVAAQAGSAHLYQRDGLLVAVWGHVGLNDKDMAARAAQDGIARVLADAWRGSPQQLCASLSGAFSLCIIDEANGTGLLALDRNGSLPLSWRLAGETLVFGSSADAIHRHPATPARIDRQGIYDYVYFHMIPSPGTVHQGVQRLLPGEYLLYKNGEVETGTYWRMRFEENGTRSFAELKEEFRNVLRSSVREAAAGSQIGAFLSGGTDSSTVAGILTEVGGRPAKTYSIGFEATGYDEMEYARIASRHFGTEHHEYYVTPDDVVAAIPQVAAVFDQPFGNASALPAFYCARMAAADGVTRMLGGDGGDELFGGNERYSKQHIFARYEQVPGVLRKGLLEPAIFNFPGGQHIKLLRKARSYIEQASVPMPARLETYNLLRRYGAAHVFTDDFLEGVDTGHPQASMDATYARSEAASLINRMLELDLKITLADNDLPKVQKACELAGVEAAFPFLSDAMVAFSARLTPRQKLNGTQLRWFFKEALRGFLPDEILRKKKHGFGMPFGVWALGHPALHRLAAECVRAVAARGVVREEFANTLLEVHLRAHPGYYGEMVWVLMMLEQWLRSHAPDYRCG